MGMKVRAVPWDVDGKRDFGGRAGVKTTGKVAWVCGGVGQGRVDAREGGPLPGSRMGGCQGRWGPALTNGLFAKRPHIWAVGRVDDGRQHRSPGPVGPEDVVSGQQVDLACIFLIFFCLM